jgi:hypothetical protein
LKLVRLISPFLLFGVYGLPAGCGLLNKKSSGFLVTFSFVVEDFARREHRFTESARELVFTFLVSPFLFSDDFAHLVLWCCRLGVNVLLRLEGSSVWLLIFPCRHFLNGSGFLSNPYSHFEGSSRLTAPLVDYETIRQKCSLAASARHESFSIELGES